MHQSISNPGFTEDVEFNIQFKVKIAFNIVFCTVFVGWKAVKLEEAEKLVKALQQLNVNF